MRPFFWDLFCSPFFDVLSYKTGIAIYDLRIRDQVPNFTSLSSVVAQLPQLEMSRPKKFYIINGFAKCAVLDFHVICVVSILLNVYTAGPLLVREMRDSDPCSTYQNYTVIPRLTRFPIARIRITRFFDFVQKNLHYAILYSIKISAFWQQYILIMCLQLNLKLMSELIFNVILQKKLKKFTLD